MFFLRTLEPGQATGKTAEIFKAFEQVGIPEPLKLLSASPGLLERQFGMIEYFRGHPNLSPQLLASIRYVVSKKTGHVACFEFNGKLLCKMGAKEEELAELADQARSHMLDQAEQALLTFVIKTVDAPKSVTSSDIETLRGLGFADSDILDATVHGANMKAATDVYLAFTRD